MKAGALFKIATAALRRARATRSYRLRGVPTRGVARVGGKVTSAVIRKVLDSRGNATVEVEVATRGGFARVAAPSGASTGATEVQAFPEGGADAAVRAFRKKVARSLVGRDVADQAGADEALHRADGTANFAGVGGNTAVAASLALARCAADERGVPLWAYLSKAKRPQFPAPMGNVIGGGAHAVGGTDIQEFMAFTRGCPPSQSVFANARVHRLVKDELKASFPGQAIGKGDEGAWNVPTTDERAMKILTKCCARAAEETGLDVVPALDLAATEFHRDGKYRYKDRALTGEEQVEFLEMLIDAHGIKSVEDPFAEDDFGSFAELTRRVGRTCMVVGDDIFTTNTERIARGVKMGAANAVLIKPNQIGTLTDTIAAVKMAKDAGYATVTSHRSAETSDDTIAHLAVAFGSAAIKTGAVGGERTAKLNELIRIEEAARGGRR
jgi:enolase